ncbi:MAG: polyphenol oxidase family protein [Myxococcota bacterium]
MPESTRFVRQVHGVVVVRGESLDRSGAVEADAITSSTPGLPVGVVTADCVPILIAREDGTRVAAVHAGWRGLAAGIIEAALMAMASPAAALRVAVGPAARACCYEVDAPVVRALEARHRGLLPDVLGASRPGHHRLDLAELAVRVLARAGVAPDRIGTAHRLCTICAPGPRFESYRRDGPAAGRLRHFIAPALDGPVPGRGAPREGRAPGGPVPTGNRR